MKRLSVPRLALAALLALALAGTAAAKPTERSRQKAQAESARSDIREKLTRLKKEITRTEARKEDVADALAESEEAISDANRSLRELAAETGQTSRKVRQLAERRRELEEKVNAQKQQIATLMREHYVAGSEDRMKLLLSGENPNRINRDLALMAYVSQAKARLLAGLRDNLAAVAANEEQAQQAKEELDEIAREEREQKDRLEREKARRRELLGSLSKKLVAQRREVGKLERDEQRLSRLVDNLSHLIRQQQAEAAARAKKRREELAARAAAKAERERLAREAAAQGKPAPKPEPEPVAPAGAAQEQEQVAEVSLGPAAPDGAFKSLKGRMRAPVAGELAVRFGARRGDDGPSWKGVFIKAPEGADVRAVAQGRVVFASWLRGFGNLLIIDHGNDYLSIYGNNQSMLKRAGDAVKGGDTIATAGNTGGNEESGLYFELRHRGRAFDPSQWVKF